MKKIQRQQNIKEVIQSHFIASQDELVQLLKKKGITTTQATLSRDLAELQVVRIHTPQGMKYSFTINEEEIKITPLVSREVVAIDSNESMIVIRTLPGRAQGVASYIDSLHSTMILGTVAGDDTVFITPRSIKKIAALKKEIHSILKF